MQALAAKITPGSTVRMHFSLTLPDGTEAASSFGEEPVGFTMGDGTLTEGLEHALYGLRQGDRQSLRVDGDYAYGPRDDDKIHLMATQSFPAGLVPEPGQIIAFQGPDGQELPGCIVEISEHGVKVDFNHPLSGHELLFKVEILSVIPAEDDGRE